MSYDKSKINEIKSQIIDLVSNGLSLNKVLKDNDSMPDGATVYSWFNPDHKNYDKEFFNNYMRAREIRAERLFEEILEISDKQDKDVIIIDGKEVTNHNVINRNRLQVDSRKWILGKMNPKKYGDKLDLTTDGQSLNLTPSERDQRIAELSAKLNKED